MVVGETADLLEDGVRLETAVEEMIRSNRIMVFSKSYCGFSRSAKLRLHQHDVPFRVVELDTVTEGRGIQNYVYKTRGYATVPSIFIDGHLIGGNAELTNLDRNGKLDQMLQILFPSEGPILP